MGSNAACRMFGSHRPGRSRVLGALAATVCCLVMVGWARGEGILCLERRILGNAAGPASSVLGDVLLLDGYAYSAAGADGLWIYDVSDPRSPVLVSVLDTPGSALRVKVKDGLAFVADGASGLQVIDVSDPAMPAILATVPIQGDCGDVVVRGGYAYAASSTAGVVVVDVTVPSSPAVVGTQSISATGSLGAKFIALAGDTLWACAPFGVAGDGTLYGLDLSDPQAPAPGVSWPYETSTRIVGLSADGAIVGVAGLWGEPQFIDVSDPSLPQALNLYYAPGDGEDPAWGVAVRGDTAMLSYFDGGIAFVDLRAVQGPFVGPAVVASIGLPGRSPGTIDLRDGLAVFASGVNGLTTIEARMPERGEVLASTVELSAISYSLGEAVATSKDLGFVFSTQLGTSGPQADWLNILDVSSEGPPAELSRVLLPSAGRAMAVQAPYAFLTTGLEPLIIVDFSDPTAPVAAGRLTSLPASPGILSQIAVDSGYAYITDGLAGWQVVDVRDVTNPVFVTRIPSGFASAVAAGVRDGVLCLVEDWIELRVFDVTDPATPTQTAVLDLSDRAGGVMLRDGVAYVAGGLLRTVDVSDPTRPVVLDELEAPSTGAGRLVVNDGYAYIPSLGGVSIVDVSDPMDLRYAARWRAPNATGGATDSGAVQTLALAGDRLLARAEGRVFLLDASDCGCPADLTGDGVADNADIAAFIGAFQAADSSADMNEDGFVNFGDVSEFIASFTAGCGV